MPRLERDKRELSKAYRVYSEDGARLGKIVQSDYGFGVRGGGSWYAYGPNGDDVSEEPYSRRADAVKRLEEVAGG